MLNFHKWDLIKAKRETMLGQLNALKYKIDKKKRVYAHILLLKKLKGCYMAFENLKMQKLKEEKSFIIAVRTTARHRVFQKRLGVTCETKKRRYAKYCLVSQVMPMNRLFNK